PSSAPTAPASCAAGTPCPRALTHCWRTFGRWRAEPVPGSTQGGTPLPAAMRPCLQGAPSRVEMIEWRLTPASLAECSFYAKWIARRHPREVSVEQYIEPYVQPIVTPENSTYALEALFRLKGSDELPVRLFRQWKDSGYVRT